MTEADAITVVIPTRNRAELLRWTLGSILAQRDVDLREVVVVDHTCTDGTPAMLAALDDPRLRVVRRDVLRDVSTARNTGLESVTTPWVAFCDDDDLWAPDKLRAQLDALATHPGARWSCVGAIHIDEAQHILACPRPPKSGDVSNAILTGNVIPGGGSGVVVDTELIRSLGGFEADVTASDWEMWIRLAMESPIATVDAPLLAYRVWSQTMSNAGHELEDSLDQIVDRWKDEADRRGVEVDRRELGHYLANRRFLSGRRADAVIHYLRAARATGDLGEAKAAARIALYPSSYRAMLVEPDPNDDWVQEGMRWLAEVRPAVVTAAIPDPVSVVIPTHNRVKLLARTLASVLGQRDVELAEVVVVDEASSDATATFLASLDDPRLRIIHHEKPVGHSLARNAGLELVSAPWVAFCDDDDVWAPNKLAAQLDALAAHPGTRWSCVGAIHVDEHDRVLASAHPPASGEVSDALAEANVVPGGGSGVLVATELIRTAGGFDRGTAPSDDWDLWSTLAAESPVATVDLPLLAYRVASTSMSHDTERMHRSLAAVSAKHPAPDPDTARRRQAAFARYLAQVAIGDGERVDAARWITRAAWFGRRPRGLLQAAVVLVAPDVERRRWDAAQRRSISPMWTQMGEEWLSELVPLGATPASSGPVSVVVPTRNRVELLRRTLISVLGQRDVEVAEIIVIDEGSTDATPSFLAGLDDPRLHVVRHDTPLGLPSARNAGLALATSPWIAFCDDDDLWAPDKLRAQFDALAAHPGARWSCVAAIHVDEADNAIAVHRPPPSGDIADEILALNPVPGGGSGVLVATDLIRQAGSFDTDLRSAEDWDAWIRVGQIAPIATVDRPLLAYRVAATSMSHNTKRHEVEQSRVIDRFESMRQERGIEFDTVTRARFLARQNQRVGERALAGRHFLHAFKRSHEARDLVRAGIAIASPRLATKVGGLAARRNIPPRWIEETDRWVAAIDATDLKDLTPKVRTP